MGIMYLCEYHPQHEKYNILEWRYTNKSGSQASVLFCVFKYVIRLDIRSAIDLIYLFGMLQVG